MNCPGCNVWINGKSQQETILFQPSISGAMSASRRGALIDLFVGSDNLKPPFGTSHKSYLVGGFNRVGPGKKNYNPWKTNLRVSPPLTPGKKLNTLEKKFKHSTWTWLEGGWGGGRSASPPDAFAKHATWFARSSAGPGDQRTTRGPQRTRGSQDQRTTGPGDQRTTGPEDQRTRGPQDQRTTGPEDQTTRGPEDQRTKQPEDHRARGA